MPCDYSRDYHIRFCTSGDQEQVVAAIQGAFMGYAEFGELARMLQDGSHPTARPEHTIAAVENASGKVVSAVVGAPQMYRYAGLPFPVINMCVLGTLPEHRERGLLRAQVEALHRWAGKAGYRATVVFGIAGLYRRFGYLPLLPYFGGRRYAVDHIRQKFPSQPGEGFSFRIASLDDLPFLARVHACAVQRYLFSFPYDEGYWKLFAFDYFPRNRDQVRVIERDGSPVGAMMHASSAGAEFYVQNFELLPAVSWLDATPAALAYALETGEAYARAAGEHFHFLSLAFGPSHPVYPFLADRMQSAFPHTYGYIRFCDLPGFLRQIAPLLEQRIARSHICGYTRDVKIELYYRTEGLVLSFQQGKLVSVHSQVLEGHENIVDRADLELPEESLIKLITGQQSIDELAQNFREVNTWNGQEGVSVEMRILMNTLFPKMDSFISPCV